MGAGLVCTHRCTSWCGRHATSTLVTRADVDGGDEEQHLEGGRKGGMEESREGGKRDNRKRGNAPDSLMRKTPVAPSAS